METSSAAATAGGEVAGVWGAAANGVWATSDDVRGALKSADVAAFAVSGGFFKIKKNNKKAEQPCVKSRVHLGY